MPNREYGSNSLQKQTPKTEVLEATDLEVIDVPDEDRGKNWVTMKKFLFFKVVKMEKEQEGLFSMTLMPKTYRKNFRYPRHWPQEMDFRQSNVPPIQSLIKMEVHWHYSKEGHMNLFRKNEADAYFLTTKIDHRACNVEQQLKFFQYSHPLLNYNKYKGIKKAITQCWWLFFILQASLFVKSLLSIVTSVCCFLL